MMSLKSLLTCLAHQGTESSSTLLVCSFTDSLDKDLLKGSHVPDYAWFGEKRCKAQPLPQDHQKVGGVRLVIGHKRQRPV